VFKFNSIPIDNRDRRFPEPAFGGVVEAVCSDVGAVFTRAIRERSGEQFYAFALMASEDLDHMGAAAMTEEQFASLWERRGNFMRAFGGRAYYRWSCVEWEDGENLDRPGELRTSLAAIEEMMREMTSESELDEHGNSFGWSEYRDAFFASMIASLKKMDAARAFADAGDRDRFVFFATITDSEFTSALEKKSVQVLNPPAARKLWQR